MSIAEGLTLLILGGLLVAAAFSGSVAWSTGRVVLYRWWLAVSVLTILCMAAVTVGIGPGYWMLWMGTVAALAGAIREQRGRGSWWLVAGYELCGPGLLVAVTAAGGLSPALGLGLAGVCAVAAPWCLLSRFDRPGAGG